MDSRRIAPATTAVALLIALIAIALRAAQFAAGRSLWVDEAMLALNIVDRSPIELLRPLDYNQGAPIGFLLVEKLLIGLLGNRDTILRLFPLLSGIASAVLMVQVARRYTRGAGVLLAMALFAVCNQLIYYASEVKQYSSDAMICLFLLFIAARQLDADATPRRPGLFILAGALSPWMSYPALFVLGAIAVGLGADQLARRDRKALGWYGLALLIWLASLGALYLVSLRSLGRNPDLLGYWRHRFMPMPPWRDLAWFRHAFLGMLENPVGLSSVSMGLAAFLAGCLSIFFRRWQSALVLVLAFPIALVASGLRTYPFGDRLLVYIVPFVCLLIGEGTERARQALARLHPGLAFGAWSVVAVLLVRAPAIQAVQNLRHPLMAEHLKPVMSYVSQHRLAGDGVYVYYGAMPAFTYYASLYGFDEDDYVIGISSRREPARYIEDVLRLRGSGRVWFVFSHNCPGCPVNEEAFYLDELDRMGTRVDQIKSAGSSSYLYDLSRREEPGSRLTPPAGGSGSSRSRP